MLSNTVGDIIIQKTIVQQITEDREAASHYSLTWHLQKSTKIDDRTGFVLSKRTTTWLMPSAGTT